MGKISAFLLTILLSTYAHAEYRVFQLLIFKKPVTKRSPSSTTQNPASPGTSQTDLATPNAADPKGTSDSAEKGKAKALPSGKVVLSTLDPLQYKTYYPIGDDMSIVYTDTWRCRGRTDGLDLCPNPKPIQPKK